MMMCEYILDNFHPDDWLVVARKHEQSYWKQRFLTAAELIEPRFESWLREQCDSGDNIYITMNTLKPDARQRTKQDIAAVRHIYLDVDYDGQAALALIRAQEPDPSYILKTSHDKYQVIWKVKDFDITEAEALQKAMALKYGADRAATDVTRVLRLPGFTNWKYDPPCEIKAEKISDRIYQPADFNAERQYKSIIAHKNTANYAPRKIAGNTQSERDWKEVCRRLRRGDSVAEVQSWLKESRPDKPNPKYYAERTVLRALIHIEQIFSEKENIMENTVNKYEPTKAGEKEYIIGTAPKGMSEVITAMSDAAKKLNEPGMLWTEEKGWHTTNKNLAEAVHQKILEKEPRYYLQGDTYAVRKELAALKDETGNRMAYLDRYRGEWYARSEEIRNRIYAAISIPQKKEMLYLAADTKAGRDAIFNIKDRLNEMKDETGKKVFSYKGGDLKQWGTTDATAFEKAKAILAEELKNPKYHKTQKAPEPGKFVLEGDNRAIFNIREQIKALTRPGPDGGEAKVFIYKKGQWSTNSPEALEKAKILLAAELKNHPEKYAPKKEVTAVEQTAFTQKTSPTGPAGGSDGPAM